MRRILINLITTVIAIGCNAARAECIDEQNADAPLPAIHGGHVWAKACSDQDGRGNIYVKIDVDGNVKTQPALRYDHEGYSLSLDTGVYFGNPRMQGVGVATGSGKDGNGMHYWLVNGSGKVVDLGDAPLLKQDSFEIDSYSALVTSSGTPYQSILYFYQIKNGKLVSNRAVGFQAGTRGNLASLLKILPGNRFEVARTKRLSRKEYEACQNSEISCW